MLTWQAFLCFWCSSQTANSSRFKVCLVLNSLERSGLRQVLCVGNSQEIQVLSKTFQVTFISSRFRMVPTNLIKCKSLKPVVGSPKTNTKYSSDSIEKDEIFSIQGYLFSVFLFVHLNSWLRILIWINLYTKSSRITSKSE